MSHYNIPEPSLEPQEPSVIVTCAWCGCEIYEGDECFSDGDMALHTDCMKYYLENLLKPENISAIFGYEKKIAARE